MAGSATSATAVPRARAVERRDPILKERMFGLTGPEGNHGEDAKEYWWYLDGLPSHALAALALPLPAGAVPLPSSSSPRTAAGARTTPSTSCSTPACSTTTATGRSTSTYAKAAPTDMLMRITSRTTARTRRRSHVLPTLWFRNTWSWDVEQRRRPRLDGDGDSSRSPTTRSPATGSMPRRARTAPAGGAVLRERDQRAAPFGAARDRRTRRTASTTTWSTAPPRSTPSGRHQGGCWYRLTVPAGGDRGAATAAAPASAGDAPAARRPARRSTTSSPARGREADEFYARPRPGGHRRRASAGPAPGLRGAGLEQAVLPLRRAAGSTATPGSRRRRVAGAGRNAGWRHLDAFDVLADAGPVGVPVVRRLGPRLPRHRLGAPRPGVRQVPAARAAREWFQHPNGRPARLRVELRRRQPAGARVGRTPGVRHRRRPRPSTSSSASSTSCCSTSRGGSTGRTPTATTSSAAASSASTTSARSTAPHLPAGARSSRPTARRGWPSTRWRCSSSRSRSPSRTAVYDDMVVKFLEQFAPDRAAPSTSRVSGTTPTTASSTTGSSHPSGDGGSGRGATIGGPHPAAAAP